MSFLKSLKSLFDKKDEPKKEVTPLKEYKIGDHIGGEYQIYRILGGEGKSGMGIVYVCLSPQNIVCALKTFQAKYFDSKEMKDNFRREALAWVHLEKHPYIVRAEWVQEFDYRLFIVLEFIAPNETGRNTLTHYLKEPISAKQALEWGIQFCYGMEHAVSCGVTPHRDIKPDNIMITANQILKITDFGLAKLWSNSGKVLESKAESQESVSKLSFIRTSGGKEMVGTLPWMAPEQFEGETNVKSDIYSFGLVIYQMMNRGNMPFHAKSIKGYEDAHKKAAVPKINTSLFPIIARCLEKKSHNRYPDFNSLRMDLGKLYSKEAGKKPPSLPEKTELDARESSNKGLSFISLGLIDKAIKEYKQAIAIKPDFAGAYYNMGIALEGKGQLDEAIKEYRQAIAIKPDFAESHSNMGNALKNKGQLDEAIKEYRQAIAIKPDFAMAHFNMGLALKDKGQLDDAIKTYRQALAIKPDFAEPHQGIGTCLYAKGQLDDAIKEYRQAIAIKPDDAGAHFNMGNALKNKGQLDEAIKEYRQAIAIKPDFAEAYNNMGITIDQKGQSEEAIKTFRQAIAIKPDYAEAHFSMGAALAAKGQLDEAIKEYRQVIAIKPDDDRTYYNLGIAFAKIDKLNEALQAFKNFVKYAPPQYAQQIEKAKKVICDLESSV